MQETARSTGIDAVRTVPWGTHFCHFYRTREDLLGILVPYFKEGLQSNERCMWVTSDPLTIGTAHDALAEALPDFHHYLERGQMEVLPHSEWYLRGGSFNLDRVLAGWAGRLDEARERGFEGLRVTGNTAWLEKGDWAGFTEYEERINDAIADTRMLAVCTYSLDRCGANEVLDVVRNHQFALINRDGKLEVIESAERKRAEMLRQSERLYRSLLDTTGAWIARFDRNGRRTLMVGADSLGIGDSIQELLLSGTGTNVMPEDQERLKDAVGSVFQTGRAAQGVLLRVTIDRELRSISTNWEPLTDGHGGVEQAQVTAFDVTAQRRLEEQYYRAQKMDSVGRLAAGISHDFNNLLAVIDGHAAMALMALPEGGPARSDVEGVRTAVGRASTLSRQLLTFARRHPSSPQTVDLGAVAADLGKLLRRVIGEDIQLHIATAPGTWPVLVDPAQIEQVLVNLAINARDAMPKGGRLTIEVSNVALDDSYVRQNAGVAAGEYVLAAVSDTGVGMTEEVRAHLFEPFYTTKAYGTGLGLATSYGIVKQNGGHIAVYTDLGQGTTFKVYLPRAMGPAPPLPERPAAAAPAARGGETVLVVEDDSRLRKLLVRMLEQLGYTALPAADGQEALRIATAGPAHFDLLLTDMVMPEMGGKELAARLRGGGFGMKVLYMSAYADASLVHGGMLEPGARFLQKPFSAASLGQRVREALDG